MGKASLPRTSINDTLDANKERKKQFGRERASRMGVSTVSSSMGSGVNSTGNTIPTIESLPTAGGTMIGPLAFYLKLESIASGILDVGQAGGYSSRIVAAVESGSADNIVRISNAAHAGQILFLQAVNTTPITLKHYTDEGSTKGNIFIPGNADHVIGSKEIVLLQWDTINVNPAHAASGTEYGQWTLVSGGGSVTDLIPSNNTWTGTNTFTGGTFTSAASISTSITSPVIYIGDQASDVVNITGAISSTATNVWSGINTFTSSVSFTGATTTIGDNVNDVFTLYGKMGSDINMSTYDITSIDRLKFSTTAGSGSALGSTDTGIEALFNSGSPYGMIIQFPSTNSAVMQIKRGSTDMINISSLGVLFGDELLMGGHKISNLGTPTATTDAATKAYVDASSGGSGAPLNGNNTWTGTNSFNGSYVTVSGTFSASGAAFTIGNASTDQLWINSTMQSDLDMGDNDLTDVQSVRFGAVSLSPLNGTLWYDGSNLKGKSSTGGTFTIDGSGGGGGPTLAASQTWTGIQTFDNGNTYVNHDLTVKDDLQVYDSCVINDNLTVDDDVTLGSSSSDDIKFNGQTDWRTNFTTTNTYGSSLIFTGYITIRVDGNTKRLYYGAG